MLSASHATAGTGAAEADKLWYKDAVLYQLHVRAFCDSTGDGIGDFPGLTSKLDYLHDLGVTALWLMPFYPSPLKDDGYDTADYTDIHASYGTLKDFKVFLKEAHARGLRVITELVLNHTSDQHAWFQRARRAKPGTPQRDFYVWSDTPEKYLDARIIFKDFEPSNWSWDPVAKAYYWHRFYAHQPDLNFDNPAVRKALLEKVDFWLSLGVDGMRLDAVPYLFEREGTNCENLPETHGFLKELRRHMDERFPGRMLLAEANQWPEDAIAYFGDGDECHTAFHFPLMPRLFMGKHMEDRFPIIDILQQTPPIPDNCQWVVFLRNHDELTLEMVTDEERDYMYRMYAHDPQARINLGIRRRLAPLLNNNRRTIELLNGLLFSLPGTPVIYYGDEIGMGDNIYLGDRNGVRTPMQWSADRNAGFSRANPQKLFLPLVIDSEYLYETVNVETQRNNPQSLWWWMKRLIALRQRHPAFGRGSLELLSPENTKVLAFVRRTEEECLLVVANLSRFTQYVELDLNAYEGSVPVEMFGHTRFPAIGKFPYLLTLGPHAFYWFALERPAGEVPGGDGKGHDGKTGRRGEGLAQINVPGAWDDLFHGRPKAALENALLKWLPPRRWFSGKARIIQTVSIIDASPLAAPSARRLEKYLTLVEVSYTEGEPEVYQLPLGCLLGEEAERFAGEFPGGVVARIALKETQQSGVVYDAVFDQNFTAALLEAMVRRRKLKGEHGELAGIAMPALREILGEAAATLAPQPVKSEQSNTSVCFGEKAILKLFRRVERGVNPELEFGRLFAQEPGFAHAPPLLGAIEYRREGEEPRTLGVLHALVPQAETAWQYTLDAVDRYFEQVLAQPPEAWPNSTLAPAQSLWDLADAPPDAKLEQLAGVYLQSITLLGTRTAELHVALSATADEPAFAPEPFTPMFQRSRYQSARKSAVQTLHLLRRSTSSVPPSAQQAAQQVLTQEKAIFARLQAIVVSKLSSRRIRCHGDYHLGQVLYTGKDFQIIDFEGEPARALAERRIKRSPLSDVAGMVRSLHYAASQGFFQLATKGLSNPENAQRLRQAATAWYLAAAAAFLRGYLHGVGEANVLPAAREERVALLDFYLLEKAIYELSYELNNRPDWIEVPLAGIVDLLSRG